MAEQRFGIQCQKVPTLYIYSWDFELLEKVEMPHPVKSGRTICSAETEDRLILAAQLFGVQYYIEKSDIGTGNVEIHPYQLPDLDLEED